MLLSINRKYPNKLKRVPCLPCCFPLSGGGGGTGSPPLARFWAGGPGRHLYRSGRTGSGRVGGADGVGTDHVVLRDGGDVTLVPGVLSERTSTLGRLGTTGVGLTRVGAVGSTSDRGRTSTGGGVPRPHTEGTVNYEGE